MKKYLILLCALFIVGLMVTGCEKVNKGNYKEGTYFGSVVDDYGGSKNLATAVIYVDSNGMIKSVFLDTTYVKDNANTTKKALKDDYGMKSRSEVKKEWYEQVELIEKKVVENQGISFINLDSNGKTDAIAGVTIKIDALYKALNNALEKAK